MPNPVLPPYIGGFEILGEIGRGGMGVVYRARDPALQRDLAIKVQSGNWEEHRDEMERFLREARILARINHPNVVQIYSVGMHEGAPFFAMELLERSVADAARLRMPSIAQLKRWMFEAARGLAAIHEMGVVHRDIKPANLLLSTPTSVENEHVKIADLGIASSGELFGTRLTQSGMVLGTTGYLAPEAWHPDANLDGRTDQYALGVVFFELLAGRSPHQFDSDAEAIETMMNPPEAPDVRTFRADVDAPTAELIATMLRTKPKDRFANTSELVQALLAVLPPAGADYRSPTPNPRAAPTLPPAVDSARTRMHEAPTLARQAEARPASRASWLIAVPVLLILPWVIWYGFGTARRLDAGSHQVDASADANETDTAESTETDPELAASESSASDAAEAASSETAADETPTTEPDSAPTADPESRSAWAEYLLGHYTLSVSDTDQAWTLSLLEQQGGQIRAELLGPKSKAMTLTGVVEAQRDEERDGSTWTLSRVRLQGKSDLQLILNIDFNEETTEGRGVYELRGKTKSLEIVDSSDL
ncbi:hypothetical protein C7S18_04680 [Ahniella affigens]|uniref:Protein kinase domain-containing protein n=1 Tax=Ahniella affigens TaxID=2021234 RepID=A0A2P1PNY5_9GAMM|nr:serine/threonine-protein kinase [Ahniella affigens]AVP96536.1 hypothetical protein C7S18_04680 [Ahniella affigens]